MKKIISLFERDYEGNRQVVNRVVSGAEWVVAGEGRATRKLDGTCCLVRDGKLYRRHEVKAGKAVPSGWTEADHDPVTGKRFGWVPVGDGPEDRWHKEAWVTQTARAVLPDGTYELLGPKIQGNPEGVQSHVLSLHGVGNGLDVPRDFVSIRNYLATHDIEGIVWHHPDGRMVKIKGRDFGLRRSALVAE